MHRFLKGRGFALAGMLALGALAGCGSGGAKPAAEEHGAAATEFERGPHRGRMLRDGDFAVEVTIFEDGVDPEFHVYAFVKDKPIDPSKVGLTVQLSRLGGRVDHFTFAPREGYLRGSGVVIEPHSFDVVVQASEGGRNHRWSYPSYEGRTTISAQAARAGEYEFHPLDGHIFEYACHEGNYALPGILAGNKFDEEAKEAKEAAEAKAKAPKGKSKN